MTHTPQSLLKRKAITIQDLLSKAENEDWHGVMDCAADLRELEAMLKVLPGPPVVEGWAQVSDLVMDAVTAEHTHRWTFNIQTNRYRCSLCGKDVSTKEITARELEQV